MMISLMRIFFVVAAAFGVTAVSSVNAIANKVQGQGPAAVNAVNSDFNSRLAATPSNEDNQTFTIEHVSSTMTSITVRWTAVWNADDPSTRSSDGAANSPAMAAIIRIEATSLLTKMTLTSPPIDTHIASTSTFTLPDLAVDTAYMICVVRRVDEDDQRVCVEMRTIPVVSMDSVLAVLLAVALVLLLVMFAVVCWRNAVHSAAKKKRPLVDDEKVCNVTTTAVGTSGEDILNDEKAPLLVPAGSSGLHSQDHHQLQPAT